MSNICLNCKDEIDPSKGKQKFCSQECSNSHRYDKVCQKCGKEFKARRVPKDGVIGCSKICRFQLRNGSRNCNICGEEYEPKTKTSTVCSSKCAGRAAQTKSAQKNRRNTIREKYGVDSVFQSEEVKRKIMKTTIDRYGGYGLASDEIRKRNEETNLKRYGTKNPFGSDVIKGKIKETNIERYGTEFPTQNKDVRLKTERTNEAKYGAKTPLQNKDVMDKMKKTNMERYGVEYTLLNEDVKEKSRQTMIKNYGVETPFLSKEIQAKIKETNLERYGTENPFGSKEVKEKIKETNLKKYGAENYSNRESLELELKERDEYVISLYNNGVSEYEIADLLNYEYITIRRVLLRSGIVKPNNISQINKYWAHKINKVLGIVFEHEGKIFTDKRMSVDLYNDELKIAIDINPTITHSTQETPYTNIKTTPIRYHQDRGIDAQDNGWELIQIFDWDNEDDIIELLHSKLNMNKRVFARKCIIKEISHEVSKDFLNENHRQEGKANSSIQYGLFYEDELTQVMTFSKERFSRDKPEDEYELLRLTSKRGITVVGGASKLFKAFTTSDYNPKEIKTFADFSKGTGASYLKLGMEYDGFANFNALYANIYTNEAYKVTQVTNKYRKEYSKLGLTQKEFMNSKGFYRIMDAGNKVFRWTRGN